MKLLYSNILPLGTEENQITVSDCIVEEMSSSDAVEIAVGYVSKAALQELDIGGNGQLELRCEIYRTNTDDGSLTIVIEGIRLYDEENNEEQTVG